MMTSVFERQEKKYLIDASQRDAIELAACTRMAPDAYGRTLITSVYLDTPERSLIARSLEKPLYKEKLRLRVYGERAGEALLLVCDGGLRAAISAYGEGLLAIPTFFELKKKYRGIVYKRRVRMSLPGAWALSRGASFESAQATFPLREPAQAEAAPDVRSRALDRQISREIEAALERHGELTPSAAILCMRTAWAPLGEVCEPRITFDDELRFIDLMNAGAGHVAITRPSESIMEVKASARLPFWLVSALNEARCYPRSFSKYGEAARIMKDMERTPVNA